MPVKPPTHRPHGARSKRDADKARPSARQRGYDGKWEAARVEFLAQHPTCACGCGGKANTVDHKTPHRGDKALFWDRTNWQAMTKRCHDRKTAKEDGRWGDSSPLTRAVELV